MLQNLSDAQIEQRLTMLEGIIAKADWKDLPSLNRSFQRLIDEQVRRDLYRRPAAIPPTQVSYRRQGQRTRDEL